MTTRVRVAQWLWVAPGAAVAAYAGVEPPSFSVVSALAAAIVLLLSTLSTIHPSVAAAEREGGILLDIDEVAVVALALVGDPVLVGLVYGGMTLNNASRKWYRKAYTFTMRVLVGMVGALCGQLVLRPAVDGEPARYLLLLGAAAVAYIVLAVGSRVGVTFAIWVESGGLPKHWYAITTADVALAGMALPLGALGADLLERAPYGALLLGVVVVGAALVLGRLLTAELAVRDEQQRREALLGRLAELSDTERRELVRQVHDGPLQQLILTRMLLGQTRRSASGDDAGLDAVDVELGRSVAELRGVLSGSGSSLVIHGLGPAVESLVGSTVVPESTVIRVVDSLPAGFGASDAANGAAAQVGLECVRELLHNALKHAGANEIRIEMAIRDEELVVGVVDDGEGFDPDAVLPQRERDGHLGFPLVRERLERIGGAMVLRSRPGEGVSCECTVPLDAPAP